MKTITVKISLYKFPELDKDVQEKIISEWRDDDFYLWEDDNNKVLTAFTNIFPVKVKDYEYGYRNYITCSLSDTISEDIKELSGLRLRTYIINNYYDVLINAKRYYCKNSFKFRDSHIFITTDGTLTGYYLDDIVLQPIHDFLKNPDERITFESLLRSCLNCWVNASHEDFQEWLSEEAIKDEITINDYDFTIDGKIY